VGDEKTPYNGLMRKIYLVLLILFTAYPSFAGEEDRIYWHIYMWCSKYDHFHHMKYSVTEELWATLVEMNTEEAYSDLHREVKDKKGISPRGPVTLGWVRGIAHREEGDFNGKYCVESVGRSGCRRWKRVRVYWPSSWADPAYIYGTFTRRGDEGNFKIWFESCGIIRADGTWLQVKEGVCWNLAGGPVEHAPVMKGTIAYENPTMTFVNGNEVMREEGKSAFYSLNILRLPVPALGSFTENYITKRQSLMCYYRIQRTFNRQHFGWMVGD